MIKHVTAGVPAKRRMMEGVSIAARTAAVTLGPMGRYALVDRAYGVPVVRDAVSAVRPIELADPLANMGVSFVRDVAVKTSDAVGDGTASAIVMFETLMQQGLKAIAAGADPGHFSRSLQHLGNTVINALYDNATPVDDDELAGIAALAAGNDPDAGRMVADALLGARGGMVIAQVAAQAETTLDIIEGIRADLVPVVPGLAPRGQTSQDMVFNPLLCLYDGVIGTFDPLVPLLEAAAAGRTLVIVASDITGDARAGLLLNRKDGVAGIVAFKPNGGARDLPQLLADLSAAAEVPVLGADHPDNLDSTDPKALETGLRLTWNRKGTLIELDTPDHPALSAHREGLRAELDAATDGRAALEKRIANLEGHSAIIHVGGHTEIAAKESRDRISAALHSARSAMTGGVVAGGGAALVHAGSILGNPADQDIVARLASQCLQAALERPMACLVENAGIDAGPVLARLRDMDQTTTYDVTRLSFAPYRQAGLMDAVETVTGGLRHAVGVAATLLNAETFILRDR